MATSREKPKADDNPAGSVSNDEVTDNQENNGKRITLELQWFKTAKKPEKYLEKSLKTWIETKNKDLKCSVLKIQEDNNALIKIEPSPDAEILQKLSGEDLTFKDGTTVTVKHVTLDSPKLDTQTADDASTMSTPSTSDDQGQMNGQSDQDSIPEQSSRDKIKNPKDGNDPDKHTHSSKSKTSDETRQRDKVEHGAAASLDYSKENNGKRITLELQWSKTAKKPEKYLEKSLKTWIQTKNKDLKCSVLKIQEDNNALIKIEPSPDAEILQKLSGEDLTFKDGTRVTVKHVTLDSPKLDTQTADDASVSSTPSTSDDQGQMNGQNDQDSIPEQSSRDKNKNPKDGNDPDKHTHSSKSKTSDETRQRDKVEHGAAASLDYSKEIKENTATKTKGPKSGDNPTGSLSKAKLPDNQENNGKLITLELQWSKTAKKPEIYLEKSLKTWIQTKNKDLKCSVLKIQEDNNALIKIEPSPDAEILQKLSGEDLTFKDSTTVTVKHVTLDSPKLDTQTADDASVSSTPSTSDDQGQMNGQNDQDSIPEQSSRDKNKNPKDGNDPDKHTLSSKRNTSDQIRQRDEVKRGAATSSDVQKEEKNMNNRHDEESKADDSAAGSVSKAEIPGRGIRQNQEEAVPVPVGFFWYLSQVYKEEIKRIEKENGCEMEVTLNVTFKAKQKDGSQQKALSEFTNLVHYHFNESRESVIPVQNVRPEQCSEAFKLIQKNEKKVLLTLTPKEITVCGPDSAQLKRVLERNAPDEKPSLLHDDTPLKMTITDPLADAGMKMEERTLKTLKNDGQITKIKEKFDVDFQEVRRDGGKVQVKASYNGPEGNPCMESNAVRALLNLYQKSITSPLNFTQHQGASGYRDTKMHEDESEKRPVPEGGATGGDSAQLKSVLERKAPDEKPYLLHDDTPLKMIIKDPLADAGMKMEERTWTTLKNDGTITKTKEKFEAEFDVKFLEVRRDGVKVQVKASYSSPEGNPCMESNAVSALLSLYQKSITSPLNFTQLQGASGFMDWTKMHEDKSEKRPVSEGGATGGDSTEDNCPICLSPFTDKKSLNCKHEFCNLCLQKAEENYGAICPICREVFGIIQGDQPDGRMSWTRSSGQVPGFSNCGIITITYSIPNGTQTEKHPKPGHWYTGTTRTAYLPDNKEGNEVLKLLKRAFDQKLIFTFRASNITGFKTQVTWNDIHHKTSLYGGPDSYGYPDTNYLSRVREELKAKGIE